MDCLRFNIAVHRFVYLPATAGMDAHILFYRRNIDSVFHTYGNGHVTDVAGTKVLSIVVELLMAAGIGEFISPQ